MEEGARATKHGARRTKDRLGISKKIADKNADKAYRLGVPHGATKGNLRRFIDKLYLQSGVGKHCTYKVYHRSVYCFDGKKLVTTIMLPQSLYVLSDKIEREYDEGRHVENDT